MIGPAREIRIGGARDSIARLKFARLVAYQWLGPTLFIALDKTQKKKQYILDLPSSIGGHGGVTPGIKTMGRTYDSAS